MLECAQRRLYVAGNTDAPTAAAPTLPYSTETVEQQKLTPYSSQERRREMAHEKDKQMHFIEAIVLNYTSDISPRAFKLEEILSPTSIPRLVARATSCGAINISPVRDDGRSRVQRPTPRATARRIPVACPDPSLRPRSKTSRPSSSLSVS